MMEEPAAKAALEVTDWLVERGAVGIHRLFIERDLDAPMPSYRDLARAALTYAQAALAAAPTPLPSSPK